MMMINSNKRVNAKVLMVGPDLALHGGIVSVVRGYLECGLPEACDGFDYLETGSGSSKLGKSVSFARSLARYSKALPSCDLVHLHISARGSYVRKSIMAQMALRAGKRVILHEHDGEFKKTFERSDEAYRRHVRKTFSSADSVVVLSEEWRDYFAENVCDSEKITVIHNGVSVPEDPFAPYLHQDVLFLGRLDANKSPDVLLFASKEVLKRFPNTKIVFGGDGEIEKNRKLAKDLGIARNCEFHGWVTGAEREALFARSGVYCLPSKNEGLPMSVLEAMARGIPTVATAVGGIPQVIQSGANGFLLDVDNEKALSAILINLLGSSELRKSIGAAGRQTIEASFDVSKSIKELSELYAGLV